MPAEKTLRLMIVAAVGWLAGVAPTRGQSPDCPVWEKELPALAPSPRDGHAMAYDSARGVTVLFGGFSYDGRSHIFGDTWEWDGVTWSLRSTVGPSARYYTAMAYDELRGVTVLFGGVGGVGDTWEWDGVAWVQRSDSGPTTLDSHQLVYDNHRGVTVLFGGAGCPGQNTSRCGDTWEWDGITWELRSSTGPSPRREHAMAYDSARKITVLYGGSDGSSQTWEWDGLDWSLRTSFVGPRSQYAHTMAYDSARGVTLLFPSAAGGVPDSQTWAWDGTEWLLFSEIGPPGRIYSAMAYDSARRVTVLFGGFVGGYYPYANDTWELPSCPVDSDGDGVNDPDDECENSDLSSTVVIDDCDSGVANHLFDDGCTMNDRIAACAEGARNHNAFRRCVKHLTKEWVREDLITPRERRSIRRCAADDDDTENDDGDDGDERPKKGYRPRP